MEFVRDNQFAQRVGTSFGKYHSTFHSDHSQVEAQLFERNQWLIAYISFAAGVKADAVTDSWVSKLHEYASEHGFKDKLKIVYT